MSSPFSLCPVEGGSLAWRQFPAIADRGAGAVGQPIVCLHNGGGGSREFAPLLDRIPAGGRLILLDWLGHGRSAPPADISAEPGPSPSVQLCAKQLHAFLNQRGIVRPILLGSGFGAAVALHYAAHHPAEVMGLVLCQPAGLIAPRKGGTVKASASATAGSPAWRQAQRIQIVKPAMQAINAEIDRSLHTSEAALRAALRSLPCPILFALSRAGRVYPLNQYLSLLDPLLALAPQHRFTVFTGSFHPVWDEPDRFAQALNSFLQALLPLSQHRHAWQLSAVDWPTRTMNLWKCVHPDCPGEQVLTEGQNPNDTGRPESARDQRDG